MLIMGVLYIAYRVSRSQIKAMIPSTFNAYSTYKLRSQRMRAIFECLIHRGRPKQGFISFYLQAVKQYG